MAASYPAAVKTFSAIVNGVTKLVASLFNSPYDEITAIETELGTDPAGSVSDVKTRLAVALNDNGTIKTDAVITTMIKTATGEVSSASSAHLTMAGGEYGFYPQAKGTAGASGHMWVMGYSGSDRTPGTTYITSIGFGVGGGTLYAQQRYVTASGKDFWLFICVDKVTKDIIWMWSAPDHPAYGNGGDFDKLPHPFLNYDITKHEILLVDNETIAELKSQVTKEKSLLTLVNEEYKPNMAKEEIYQPLHSGKFLGKEPELVQTIPTYIKVRKLEKLTQAEKDQKEAKGQQAQQKAEQDKQKKAQDKISAENKLKVLGLTEAEIVALR